MENCITEIEEKINRHNEDDFIYNSEYAGLVGKFKGETALSADMADAFIEKVLVDSNHNIEVIFKF